MCVCRVVHVNMIRAMRDARLLPPLAVFSSYREFTGCSFTFFYRFVLFPWVLVLLVVLSSCGCTHFQTPTDWFLWSIAP